MLQLPQIGWIKATEVYPLRALEARNSKSRRHWALFPPKLVGQNTSLLLLSFRWLPAILGVPWLVDVSLKSPSSHGLLLSVSVCSLSSFKDSIHWV